MNPPPEPNSPTYQPKLPPQTPSRLEAQIRFLIEVDRLKSISRRTYLSDESRRENSAEHSWHFALGVLLMSEYGGDFDVFRAMKMAIVHDIVEIDAGDTFVYDDAGLGTKVERENAAADRLFGMLPPDQDAQFRALWEEFELGQSKEARFALAIDRLCPVVLNYTTDGRSWRESGVGASRVRDYNLNAMDQAPALQKFIDELLAFATQEGIISP